MSATEHQAMPVKPSLITSLLAGFDAITNHIELVLFPLALDLFLWLGPHLRLKNLVEQILSQMVGLPGVDSPDAIQALELNRELWLLVADRLNLFSALRTYPVGIASLMVSRQPIATPLEGLLAWEATSIWGILVWWFLLTIVGIIAGALYYTLVAQASFTGKVDWRSVLGQWPWAAMQALLLSAFMYGLLLAISIPGSCLITASSLGGLPVAQFTILLFGALMLWILFPLFFSAHGIFTFQYKVWTSIKQGARLTRLTLPTTSMLFLTIIIISEGLDTLWRIPPENSWMTLIGVTGHAFVTTGLLAASFIYYRDASRWVQRLIQQSLMVESKHLRERIT